MSGKVSDLELIFRLLPSSSVYAEVVGALWCLTRPRPTTAADYRRGSAAHGGEYTWNIWLTVFLLDIMVCAAVSACSGSWILTVLCTLCVQTTTPSCRILLSPRHAVQPCCADTNTHSRTSWQRCASARLQRKIRWTLREPRLLFKSRKINMLYSAFYFHIGYTGVLLFLIPGTSNHFSKHPTTRCVRFFSSTVVWNKFLALPLKCRRWAVASPWCC